MTLLKHTVTYKQKMAFGDYTLNKKASSCFQNLVQIKPLLLISNINVLYVSIAFDASVEVYGRGCIK